MRSFPPRTLRSEAQKYAGLRAGDGLLAALRLGEEMLALFLAAHPETTPEQARTILHRNKTRGRRPSSAARC